MVVYLNMPQISCTFFNTDTCFTLNRTKQVNTCLHSGSIGGGLCALITIGSEQFSQKNSQMYLGIYMAFLGTKPILFRPNMPLNMVGCLMFSVSFFQASPVKSPPPALATGKPSFMDSQ